MCHGLVLSFVNIVPQSTLGYHSSILSCFECNHLQIEVGVRESAYFSAIDRFSTFKGIDNSSRTLIAIHAALWGAIDESRNAMANAALKLEQHRQEHRRNCDSIRVEFKHLKEIGIGGAVV
jgi:hypothetical protein